MLSAFANSGPLSAPSIPREAFVLSGFANKEWPTICTFQFHPRMHPSARPLTTWEWISSHYRRMDQSSSRRMFIRKSKELSSSCGLCIHRNLLHVTQARNKNIDWSPPNLTQPNEGVRLNRCSLYFTACSQRRGSSEWLAAH